MATPLPFQSLDEQPRIHFAEFERQVYDEAGSACVDLFRHGLLFLVVSDSIWATLLDNSVITDGITTIAPRPTPQNPQQPADNPASYYIIGASKYMEASKL
jgi:hypothetical protein